MAVSAGGCGACRWAGYCGAMGCVLLDVSTTADARRLMSGTPSGAAAAGRAPARPPDVDPAGGTLFGADARTAVDSWSS